MKWTVILAGPAKRNLERTPEGDRKRIGVALLRMRENPFFGDIEHLKNCPIAWRRRVGSWRLLYNLYPQEHRIDVVAIRRHASKTYSK